ncbi:MAG: recombinase family protein, partial [Chloroflexota bacterium]|nr:recombinase family protein [Chloroflexota bacterium]
MRAVAYIRVSSVSQVEGYSLDAQERCFRDHCRSKGWEALRVYREEGRSAHLDSIKKRPVFRQLLDDASKGSFDVVVVHTLDRWSRNLKVLLESVSILDRHEVGLVSITENLDWSTAQGRLVARTLGSFGEFFSDMLATHVQKGVQERALRGLHLGAIPFGYESCWIEEAGERHLKCNPEHPGSIHIHPQEGPAVQELFRRYSKGMVTLSTLATWLNKQGFRTRNRHKLPDAEGNLKAEPRLFTLASVRGILHNPFYMGKVRHKDQILPGAHEPLISKDLFETVQLCLKRNSGRSETLKPNPEREYLLKGIIRCVYCGMPMWAQTYKSGHRCYREHRGSRGAGNCINKSGS